MAVSISAQEGIDLLERRTRQRPARDEIADVVALGRVLAQQGLGAHAGWTCNCSTRFSTTQPSPSRVRSSKRTAPRLFRVITVEERVP